MLCCVMHAGKTPLLSVDLALVFGADPNEKDTAGRTALHIAADYNAQEASASLFASLMLSWNWLYIWLKQINKA